MKLADFDYHLPKELIAQYPLLQRDAARLLVLKRREKSSEHRIFKDILDYLQPNDLLVLNNTKVLPCRLRGERISGGKVEVLLLERKGDCIFNALLNRSRLKVGEKIIFNGAQTQATLTAKGEIRFSGQDIDKIYNLGTMPLPPYIKREPQDLDKVYYQTVYAKKEGAVASPTAGLHFTKKLMRQIILRGINIAYVTLHIGYATFKPVKIEDITAHKMDKEYFEIKDETISLIKQTKARKGRIIAVGTTGCRALEAYAQGVKSGYTDLFIYPGYKFQLTDCLLTNFHLPRTTLLMLVSAFAGEKMIKEAYQQAIDQKYRFYSYGDAMLIV